VDDDVSDDRLAQLTVYEPCGGDDVEKYRMARELARRRAPAAPDAEVLGLLSDYRSTLMALETNTEGAERLALTHRLDHVTIVLARLHRAALAQHEQAARKQGKA